MSDSSWAFTAVLQIAIIRLEWGLAFRQLLFPPDQGLFELLKPGLEFLFQLARHDQRDHAGARGNVRCQEGMLDCRGLDLKSDEGHQKHAGDDQPSKKSESSP